MNKERAIVTKDWLQQLHEIATLKDSVQRFGKLLTLHDETLQNYVDLLNSIFDEEAQQITTDGRTRAIVVAHIMAWEEWQTQVFKDQNPFVRLDQQLQYKGYYDADKKEMVDFNNSNRHKSVDDFNAYQAEKYKNWAWEDIHGRAVDTAVCFRDVFTQQSQTHVLNFLDNTSLKVWKIAPDMEAVVIPAGWYLWMISLKHEAVEHTQDLKP